MWARHPLFFRNVCRRSLSRDAMLGTVNKMFIADRLTVEDLPDLPHSRQLRSGIPWLTFDEELETEFRQTNLDENIGHIRVNLGLAIAITLAFSAVEAMLLGRGLNRIPGMIHIGVIVPLLLGALAASFSPRRHRIYP